MHEPKLMREKTKTGTTDRHERRLVLESERARATFRMIVRLPVMVFQCLEWVEAVHARRTRQRASSVLSIGGPNQSHVRSGAYEGMWWKEVVSKQQQRTSARLSCVSNSI